MSTDTESVELVGDEAVENVARAALLAALTGAFAYVSFPTPFSPAPVSLQVLGVFLAGLLLGPVWGGLSMGLYLVAGAVGAPVFAGGASGLGTLLGPTGGYLWSYPAAAFVVGALAHGGLALRDPAEQRIVRLGGALVVGTGVVYACGVVGMSLALGVTLQEAFVTGALAFVPAEAFKIAAAAEGDGRAAESGGRVGERAGSAAVDGVSLTIRDGEFVVLAGPNGSGKTTLVRHFNGLLEPDRGAVLVDGTPVADDLVAARTRVGMVFQNPRDGFVAATVGADVAFGPENLGLSRSEIDRRVGAALAAVNMTGRADDRIDSLSGGERERVAIAGALAMEPAHLVLDEPFTGLDAPARESVLAHLRDLHAAGTGVVVVTHDLRDVWDLADRVVALSRGRVAVDTPPVDARERLADLGVRAP